MGYPTVGPTANASDNFFESMALISKVVFNPNGRFGNDSSGDETFALKFLEAVAEHFVADVWNGLFDFVEANCTLKHDEQDGAAPTAANDLHCMVILGAQGVI